MAQQYASDPDVQQLLSIIGPAMGMNAPMGGPGAMGGSGMSGMGNAFNGGNGNAQANAQPRGVTHIL